MGAMQKTPWYTEQRKWDCQKIDSSKAMKVTKDDGKSKQVVWTNKHGKAVKCSAMLF